MTRKRDVNRSKKNPELFSHFQESFDAPHVVRAAQIVHRRHHKLVRFAQKSKPELSSHVLRSGRITRQTLDLRAIKKKLSTSDAN